MILRIEIIEFLILHYLMERPYYIQEITNRMHEDLNEYGQAISLSNVKAVVDDLIKMGLIVGEKKPHKRNDVRLLSINEPMRLMIYTKQEMALENLNFEINFLDATRRIYLKVKRKEKKK